MKRRNFIRNISISSVAPAVLPALIAAQSTHSHERPQACWVENGEPGDLLAAGMESLGGFKRFISPGDIVVVKPNIGWDKQPQFAANTNPILIKCIIENCFNNGAKAVKVFDNSCNNPRRCYQNSGIEQMVRKAGGDVLPMRENRYVPLTVNHGKIISEWPVYRDYLEADKTINVPVAKHHSLCRVTLGLKNLMGVMGGNRGSLHTDFDVKLVDITQEILPALTIIDAYRILVRNGPGGGNLNDVNIKKTIIISDCVVTADSIALALFDLKTSQVGYLVEAFARQLQRYDPQSIKIKKKILA